MSRAAIFDAFRKAKPGIFDEPAHITILDGICDDFGIPRDGPIRTINAAGLDLIKQFEGCRLTAYRDPIGVLTIGYGSTGPHVKPGMTITREQADDLLRQDVARFEMAVADMAKVATDNQFAALVSLAFNVGAENVRRSTLLRLHNEGDYAGAKAQFSRWRYAAGRVLPGLVRRRDAEAELYAS
ncbi:MAG: hypothetical protein RL268_193 [Pseudomonadota bacterium]|jgi:lysozyme